MKKPSVKQALDLLTKSTGQVSAVRRALEKSMDAPGGLEWENQITELEELESRTEAEAPKSQPLQAREAKLREQFSLNWFKRRRKRGP